MVGRICHLCGTYYNDDPYFKEQPAHTPQDCLDLLSYRFHKAEVKLSETKRQLVRAQKEYHLITYKSKEG